MFLPKVHYFADVTSCMDVAFDLIREDRLDIWDSVLARSQTAGRGQMRKVWHSPQGNLFGAIRLPHTAPFDSTAAAIAISALCANALRSFGCNVMVKWPNDLILCQEGEMGKIAGILLEDRQEGLVAGIGINILYAPELDKLDHVAPMPAASLAQTANSDRLPTPHELWLTLVRHIYSVYKNGPVFSEIWKPLAEDLLLWRGTLVDIYDDGERFTGTLAGLNDAGAAVLDTGYGIEEKLSGAMRHVRENN